LGGRRVRGRGKRRRGVFPVSRFQTMTRMERATATRAELPRRLTGGGGCSVAFAMEGARLAAAASASPARPSVGGCPAGADARVTGRTGCAWAKFANEPRCAARVGKRRMSSQISAMITWCVVLPMPRFVEPHRPCGVSTRIRPGVSGKSRRSSRVPEVGPSRGGRRAGPRHRRQQLLEAGGEPCPISRR